MTWTARASNGAELRGDQYLTALRAALPNCSASFQWMAEEVYMIRDAFVANRERVYAEQIDIIGAYDKWIQFLRACDQMGWDVESVRERV